MHKIKEQYFLKSGIETLFRKSDKKQYFPVSSARG